MAIPKVGDKIRIVHMVGEPQYNGKVGTVTYMYEDPWGDLAIDGTWGGLSVYPADGDEIEIIKEG